MTTIYDILDQLRAAATSNRGLGTSFERLVAAYLRTDPLYFWKYSNVWLWDEWPGRQGVDTGIDIVAEEADGGGLCAIQCKFLDPHTILTKENLDSFFTASGKLGFTSRLVVSTTDKWSKHAEDALEGQQIPVQRLRMQDLDASPVDWSEFALVHPEVLALKPKKHLRPHQALALEKVKKGFKEGDRGKIIMACGTGKTFTALKIMEELVPEGGSALFLVPSISLLSQALKEWSSESTVPLHILAVCSDVKVGKRTDSEDIGSYDLAYPASTDPMKLLDRIQAAANKDACTVIFSTYQSLAVVADAQALGLAEFDLVICDEAHRTTGVTLSGEDESSFVSVHDQDYLQARNRLYMTATPRIYDDGSKVKAQDSDAILCSMDDETLFGPEFHRLGFGEAVAAGLLSDYKVLILAVDEKHVASVFKTQLSKAGSELNLTDAAKIVGCWNGLSKRGVTEDTFTTDPNPMRRAVAFSRSIKDSKRITELFNGIVSEYSLLAEENDLQYVEIEHVDGTFNALQRSEKLDWLRKDSDDSHLCRVLSNVRCLSEGVDVPALDAVMFLNPRNSQIDVVQSVGRVMRKAEGKEYGYVILPIGIPAEGNPSQALNDNKNYQVVWQVLQALRAHDDRFNAMVNKLELNSKKDDQIQVIGIGGGAGSDYDPNAPTKPVPDPAKAIQGVLNLIDIEEWKDAIYAKIVQKVGDRRYWEDWAKDVALIAQRHVTRIKTLLGYADSALATIFADFVAGLRLNLNDSITEEDAIDMLSQHLITKPVFDALFSDYSFASSNPVSIVMQQMVDALDEHNLDTETETLDRFYESVRLRAEGVDNAEGRQRIIVELYEKFFKSAFPKTTDSLGVVYTPIDIVDFILHGVETVLNDELEVSINDEGVHVLDPFTGTGTFLVRLIQSGIITPDALARKYANELHANEIVLLAYYIAAINIEATYHDLIGGPYRSFDGIVLNDTFQMSEGGGLGDDVFFPQNSARAAKQKATDIQVVIGNPPYSVGQESENDNNRNLTYPKLDDRIRQTYVGRSTTTATKRNMYDSYVRAFRWASDRVNDKGVICFVSNGSFIDTGSADGFRRTLMDEFSSIYCLNLRGNARTSGEMRMREKGNVFGSGSRTPVAVTLLVKNPKHIGTCKLHYYDIGDYLTREEKLSAIVEFGDIRSVPWQAITPDLAGDWINLRHEEFESFAPLGVKRGDPSGALFGLSSSGIVTSRDSWVYSFSKNGLLETMHNCIAFFNEECRRISELKLVHDDGTGAVESVEDMIDRNPARISWSSNLIKDVARGSTSEYSKDFVAVSMYRPFCKQWLYGDRRWHWSDYSIPKLFPTPAHKNTVIAVSAGDARRPFSTLMIDCVPDYHLHDVGQSFPLYYYTEESEAADLFSANDSFAGYKRRDAITDATRDRFCRHYAAEISKEEIFYYVYGVLHSPEYRSRFASDLKKLIPRIPMSPDFTSYSSAGQRLAEWHLNYETIDPWPLEGLPEADADPAELRVTKMAFGKYNKETDKSTIVVNPYVVLRGIPDEAYEYEVNGKSALAWIMDRYQVKTDKESGIVNDPNGWSDDPRYVVDLVARIVRVSVESAEIVRNLPPLGV